MWCKVCRQDVPGVVAAEAGGYSCLRCGQLLEEQPAASATPEVQIEEPNPAVGAQRSSVYDGWELDEQLRHIGRRLGKQRQAGTGRNASVKRPITRLDPAHTAPPECHHSTPLKYARRSGRSAHDESSLPVLTWTTLLLGLTAFVCGGVLLGWSFLSGREDLWSIGLPIALGGQIGLLAALVLQLDRLWEDNRHASAKLDNVDSQLHDLKTATTMLGTSHHSASGAFYAHLADGAGSQLLLSDLKSQLDLLAVKIGQEEGD